MNKWYKFIKGILRDFRETTYTLEKNYGLKGFSSKMTYLSKTENRVPNQNTIQDLEKIFNIKIDDHDPEKLTYRLISEIKEPISAYGAPELTKEDLELLIKLKKMGIDSVEKLEKLYNYEDIAEDIKELLKKKLRSQL